MNSENCKWPCPICNAEIDEFVCADICLVAEGVSPEDELPIGMALKESDIDICLKCHFHLG